MTIIFEDPVYMSVADMAKKYGQSRSNIYRILSEMGDQRKRYGEGLFLNEVGDKLVNTLAYEDYLIYRGRLIDRNLARHVPPYDPVKIRRARGEYQIQLVKEVM